MRRVRAQTVLGSVTAESGANEVAESVFLNDLEDFGRCRGRFAGDFPKGTP